MKVFGVVGTTLLFLLLGAGIQAYAQDGHEDAKPQAQEEEKAKQEEAKPAKAAEDKNVRQEEKKDENTRVQEEKTTRQEDSKTVQNDHRVVTTHAEAGRIPEDKFRAHFGVSHTFRIGHPVIVEGRPRFSYGGFSFVMVDPWPVGWAYTDAVYIDFIDGVYYVVNPVHPGIRVAVNIAL